jgi:prevent-host-death family protein
MQRTVSATEAHAHFGDLLRRVAEGQETVFVERGGETQAVLLSVVEYERLVAARQEPEDWLARIDRLRSEIKAELGDRRIPPVDDVIRQMREERDEQLLDGLR